MEKWFAENRKKWSEKWAGKLKSETAKQMEENKKWMESFDKEKFQKDLKEDSNKVKDSVSKWFRYRTRS